MLIVMPGPPISNVYHKVKTCENCLTAKKESWYSRTPIVASQSSGKLYSATLKIAIGSTVIGLQYLIPNLPSPRHSLDSLLFLHSHVTDSQSACVISLLFYKFQIRDILYIQIIIYENKADSL